MEHVSISDTKTELDIQRNNDYVVPSANKYKYQLPKKNYLDLLKKRQDNILIEEGKCWFIDGKTFDELIEKKHNEVRAKKFNDDKCRLLFLRRCNNERCFHCLFEDSQ